MPKPRSAKYTVPASEGRGVPVDDPSKQMIHVKGARVHNLKNIEVQIPHNELVVITGLSGSGKSTLAFDTIFAEGQRRYVESLSAYARQFLGKINKPEVDFITGIAPAIAIEQKVNTRNPRSTVGTSTEIYDYLKLLFARIGHTYSPVSGREVTSHTVADVVNYIVALPPHTRILVTAPLILGEGQGLIEKLTLLSGDGFQRVYIAGEVLFIEDVVQQAERYNEARDIRIVIDRAKVSAEEDLLSRLGDSVSTAFNTAGGMCDIVIQSPEGDRVEHFSSRFELDGIRGVLPECRHLLIEGDGCSADVPAGKLTVLRRGNRLLVGVAAHFRPELIDADIDALLAERKRYFETLPDFVRCRPAPASDAGQGVFTAEGAGQLRLRRDSVPVDDAGPLAAPQDVALGLGLSRGRTAPFRSGDGAGEPARRAVAAASGRPDSAYDVAARPFGGDPAAGAGLRHRGGR